ncbi:glycogen/starch synthase [Pseudomonas aeruginosa]|nr:glycogen/starch synthase [Pseudomonas aeruginosa]
MGHSVAGVCLEEPAVLTAFPSLLHPQDPPQQRDRILFVTAELSDFVKVGGLGDFSAALPRSSSASIRCESCCPAIARCWSAAATCGSSAACPAGRRSRPARSAW